MLISQHNFNLLCHADSIKSLVLWCLCSRLTLSETDGVQRQSYKQQQVAHFMVQRSPSQSLSLGCSSKAMTTHQLPFCNTDRKLHRDVNTFGRKHQDPVAHERGDGGVDKKERITFRKPIRVNFRASSLMSSPREVSQRVQRREWCEEEEGKKMEDQIYDISTVVSKSANLNLWATSRGNVKKDFR